MGVKLVFGDLGGKGKSLDKQPLLWYNRTELSPDVPWILILAEKEKASRLDFRYPADN